MSEPNDVGKSVAILMVRDAYANYVVQTTLDVVPDSEEKTLLLDELMSHSEELVSFTVDLAFANLLVILSYGLFFSLSA